MLSVGNSTYNGLQVSANKRFHHGLTILVNYTWSKSIDEGSNDGDTPSNPFNIRNDRAVSNFNLPHKFVGSFVWQLPGSVDPQRAGAHGGRRLGAERHLQLPERHAVQR